MNICCFKSPSFRVLCYLGKLNQYSQQQKICIILCQNIYKNGIPCWIISIIDHEQFLPLYATLPCEHWLPYDFLKECDGKTTKTFNSTSLTSFMGFALASLENSYKELKNQGKDSVIQLQNNSRKKKKKKLRPKVTCRVKNIPNKPVDLAKEITSPNAKNTIWLILLKCNKVIAREIN